MMPATLPPEPSIDAISETRFVDHDSGRLAFDVRGDTSAPLVVMLPSLGDVRQEYRFLAPLLVAAGYCVVTMDLRGHGESSTGWPDYAPASSGGDLLALLHHLGDRSAFVVGTSFAAAAAAWAAAEEPALVRGLVLIGPFVRDTPPQIPLQNVLFRIVLAKPWGVAFWSSYYTSLYPTQKPADFETYRDALKRNLREPGRFDAAKGMAFSSKADVEQRLADVKAPTLVVMGSRDPDFGKGDGPEREALLVADRLRGTAVMVEGAGHYPHAEMPEKTAPLILDFLRRHTAAQ